MNNSMPRYSKGPLLRGVTDLDDPQICSESVRHLRDARVVVAEYEILQHDFAFLRTEHLLKTRPHLSSLDPLTLTESIHSLIDDWLLANAGFVSATQAQQAIVNTPISSDDISGTGYRPANYGRSLVVAIERNPQDIAGLSTRDESAGLLDLKGAGVAPGVIPSNLPHSNGLDYVGSALSDYLTKLAIDEIFRRAAPSCWTVPIYAILDLGFDVVGGWCGTAPAGMHVRRAHRRPSGGMLLPQSESIDEIVTVEIEMLLRSYGLTTAHADTQLQLVEQGDRLVASLNGQVLDDLTGDEIQFLRRIKRDSTNVTLEAINVQLTRETSSPPSSGQMVDFGHVHVRRSFNHPVYSPVRDVPLCVGGVLWPDHLAYIQPIPELCLPLETWWRSREINPLCFRLAEQFRNGQISRVELRHVLEEPLRALLRKWN